MKKITKNILKVSLGVAIAGALVLGTKDIFLEASSHREAPMISNDPLADNTDLYAFKSPTDPGKITIIANYIPFELPQGGPNYYSFGENIRYEIHIKNDTAAAKANHDDITYRFTFTKTNEDTTTFFDIRLGKENNKVTYKLEKIIGGDESTIATIIPAGTVPPPNIGPRSIGGPAGLMPGTTYENLMQAAVMNASTGEKVFCGPVDDPFFVDLGGIFDLGMTRAKKDAVDGLAKYNVHTIALSIPVTSLLKSGVGAAKNILDSDYIIGVWASASRPQVKTLGTNGTVTESGPWVQVSRIGMPLTNEAVMPIGQKDKWNARTPYTEDQSADSLFGNPELALYMGNGPFGSHVPAFKDLKVQTASKTALGAVDFRNGKDGLYGLRNDSHLTGTALDPKAFGTYLLRDKQPRSVDLLPIFHTGVPNINPYQLATGKSAGNPLTPGKPFINNFFPNFGDMLRLNMAVPATDRNDPKFNSLGLVYAAVLGLTDTAYTNHGTALQFIPNMDGFPNGRRLEDDVTTIELQAVSGVVLAAIGLWYDDYNYATMPATAAVSPQLLGVLGYSAGVTANDTTFKTAFPFVQTPWSGYNMGAAGGPNTITSIVSGGLGLSAPQASLSQNYPNAFDYSTTIKYRTVTESKVAINIYDLTGRMVQSLVNSNQASGNHEVVWNAGNASTGFYIAVLIVDGKPVGSIKMKKE